MTALPSPVTVTDEYLAALHGVLTEIRDRLPEPKPAPERADGAVAVAEPVRRAPAKKAPGRGRS